MGRAPPGIHGGRGRPSPVGRPTGCARGRSSGAQDGGTVAGAPPVSRVIGGCCAGSTGLMATSVLVGAANSPQPEAGWGTVRDATTPNGRCIAIAQRFASARCRVLGRRHRGRTPVSRARLRRQWPGRSARRRGVTTTPPGAACPVRPGASPGPGAVGEHRIPRARALRADGAVCRTAPESTRCGERPTGSTVARRHGERLRQSPSRARTSSARPCCSSSRISRAGFHCASAESRSPDAS